MKRRGVIDARRIIISVAIKNRQMSIKVAQK